MLVASNENEFFFSLSLFFFSLLQVCLVLVASNENEFFSLSASKDTVATMLLEAGALPKIQVRVEGLQFRIEEGLGFRV